MRPTIVAGNWKMYGSLAENLDRLTTLANAAAQLNDVQVIVFPTFPYLLSAHSVLGGSGIAVGAQTVSEFALGAYTGEVSAAMLADVKCSHVLVGHSERRTLFAETDVQIAAKFIAAQSAGLIPVLCVGESLAERQAGQTEEIVFAQLDAVIHAAGVAAFARAVIAYEPVWAIGSGLTASPEQAQAVHVAIRQRLAAHDINIAQNVAILYGGSVKPDNASALFAQADIDGGLVGGASLQAQDFIQICSAVEK
jgi:triosephosphate isomerase (TIM)